MKFKIWHLIALLLLIPYLLGDKCGGTIEPPPSNPTYCGEGAGEYYFKVVGSIDTIFDCNNLGSFVINLQPKINSSYWGFNRLDFRLTGGGHTYRSNYVEFDSNHTTGTQQLEWGGSLQSGKYQLVGYLDNFQLGSTCDAKIAKLYNEHLADIHITQFTNPSKVMYIEYDCQLSDTLAISEYDVFLSPNTDEYMNIAFNIANTTYSKIPSQTDLPAELIIDSTSVKRQYISDHKQFDDKMYLCGIKGFKDTNGNLIIVELGSTILSGDPNFTPCNYSGSLVAIKACMINAALQKYTTNYDDFVTAITIHELGHQRAILSDYEGHDSKFCIMKQGLVNNADSVSRYHNPHFCENCITKIKSINW